MDGEKIEFAIKWLEAVKESIEATQEQTLEDLENSTDELPIKYLNAGFELSLSEIENGLSELYDQMANEHRACDGVKWKEK